MTRTRVVHINDNVPGAVYIGRANGHKGMEASRFANPFRMGTDGDRSEVVHRYRFWIDRFVNARDIQTRHEWRNCLAALAGKPLACWCRHDGEARTPDNACHGDVLIDLINELGLEPQP